MSRIYLSAPDVGELEAKDVQEALASGWVAPVGPDLTAFEAEVAARVGGGHAVALSFGTAGLHLGLLALGVGSGDVVLTSTMTFAATANAITYTGAVPLFVDSDLETGNVDVTLMRAAAEQVRASGRRIGALLPVDLLGKCVDMGALAAHGEHFVNISTDKEPNECAGPLEATRRASDRLVRQARRGWQVSVGAVRQRAGQPGVGGPRVCRADRERRRAGEARVLDIFSPYRRPVNAFSPHRGR